MILSYFSFLLVLVASGYIFYQVPVPNDLDSPQVFLTIATFLFAIFTGFFISRQGTRFSAIREKIAKFDGEMTSIYRQFEYINKKSQVKVGEIVKKHYKLIQKHQAWDYHFVNKSSTLRDIYQLTQDTVGDKSFSSLKHLATQRILVSLENMQVLRKGMVSLHRERVPQFQWVLIYFLAIILLFTIFSVPSLGTLYSAILKSVFTTFVIFTVVLLHQFDQLNFFEGTIGQRSAEDVIDIIAGKK